MKNETSRRPITSEREHLNRNKSSASGIFSFFGVMQAWNAQRARCSRQQHFIHNKIQSTRVENENVLNWLLEITFDRNRLFLESMLSEKILYKLSNFCFREWENRIRSRHQPQCKEACISFTMFDARTVCACVLVKGKTSFDGTSNCMVCGHTESAYTDTRTHYFAKRKKSVAQLRRMPVDVLRGAHSMCLFVWCSFLCTHERHTNRMWMRRKKMKKIERSLEISVYFDLWSRTREHPEYNATDRYYVLILFACFCSTLVRA